MKSIISLIGEYLKYLTQINNVPIFNSNTFLANQSSKDRPFFQDFIHTQLFQQYIEDNNSEKYPYFNKHLLKFAQIANNPTNKKRKATDSIKSLFKRSSSVSVKEQKEKSELNKSSNSIKKIENNINIVNNISRNSVNEVNDNKTNSFSRESHGNKSEEIRDYSIILPYFIQEDIIKQDFNKLDMHIKEKYKGMYFNSYIDCIPTRIFTYNKNFDFDKLERESVICQRYLFNFNDKDLRLKKSSHDNELSNSESEPHKELKEGKEHKKNEKIRPKPSQDQESMSMSTKLSSHS